MYEVTEATLAEVPKITILCKAFENETAHVKVDISHSIKSYCKFIDSGVGAMLLLKRDGEIIGGLGCLHYPDLHSGELTAVETFWFVDPGHRGKGLMLLDEFEKWAARQECTKVAMIHMVDSHPDILEKLYIRRGYKLVEKHFVKEVTP